MAGLREYMDGVRYQESSHDYAAHKEGSTFGTRLCYSQIKSAMMTPPHAVRKAEQP